MDFDDAIQAHTNWKIKLSAYIKKPDHSVDHSVLAQDDRCALGKWLHGEGAKHNALTEYQELVKIHAQFHKAAAEIVRRADAGEKVAEEVAFGAQSDYNKFSTHVVQQIIKLKGKVGSG